jgi:hypothetical protein
MIAILVVSPHAARWQSSITRARKLEQTEMKKTLLIMATLTAALSLTISVTTYADDNNGDDYGHYRYHGYYDRNGEWRDSNGRVQSDPNYMGSNSSDPNYVPPNR